MKPDLSPTMQECVDFMKAHGDMIHRHPGGFWSHETWQLHSGPYFGASTVEALVKRGHAEYDQWKGPADRLFPVRAVRIQPPTPWCPSCEDRDPVCMACAGEGHRRAQSPLGGAQP